MLKPRQRQQQLDLFRPQDILRYSSPSGDDTLFILKVGYIAAMLLFAGAILLLGGCGSSGSRSDIDLGLKAKIDSPGKIPEVTTAPAGSISRNSETLVPNTGK